MMNLKLKLRLDSFKPYIALGIILFLMGIPRAFSQTLPIPGGDEDSAASEQLVEAIRIKINAVDPTAQSNPAGRNAPGFRGPNQFILYSPDYGATTKTNESGAEITVLGDHVEAISSGNSPIPPNGYVISGHGRSGLWLKRSVKLGDVVSFQPELMTLTIKTTPEVYLRQVDDAIRRARSGALSGDRRYQAVLSQSESCGADLRTMAVEEGLSKPFIQKAEQCRRLADKAFYYTIPDFSQSVRGVWVRPVEKTPQDIEKSVQNIVSAKIQDIFLETYFQGETLYPSQVMASYGLPEQHAQFKGWDPLQQWVDIAHAHGLKVHAWFQTFFAGNRDISLEEYGPILHHYPEWANVQRSALSQKHPMSSTVEDGHYFLDPANPEVRTFLHKLIDEIVTHYPVDGINLDYIRYPASLHKEQSGYVASTWGYTSDAQKAFEAWVKPPPPEPPTEEKPAEPEPKPAPEEAPAPLVAKDSELLPPLPGEQSNETLLELPKSDEVVPTPKAPVAPKPVGPKKEVSPPQVVHTPDKKAKPVSPKAKPGEKVAHAKLQSTANEKPKEKEPVVITDPKALTPRDPMWQKWIVWRKAQVSSFVSETAQQVHQIKPNVLISAVVFPKSDPQNLVKLQDWPAWVEKGWLQALTPIGLGNNPDEIYRKSLEFKTLTKGKVPVYIGIFGMYNRVPPATLVSEVDAVHKAGLPGVVFFERSRLTPEYKEALLDGVFSR